MSIHIMCKRLIFIMCVMFFGMNLFSQTAPMKEYCGSITKIIRDEVRDVTRIVSKDEIRINDTGGWGLFHVVIMRAHEDYSFIIRKVDKECFAKDTPVTFYFRDGSKLKFISTNKDNCESALLVSMGGIFGNSDKINSFLKSYLVGIEFNDDKGNPYRLKIETPNTELIREIFECMKRAY